MPDPLDNDFDLDELQEFWALDDSDFDDDEINDEMADYEVDDWEDNEEDIDGNDALEEGGWL